MTLLSSVLKSLKALLKPKARITLAKTTATDIKREFVFIFFLWDFFLPRKYIIFATKTQAHITQARIIGVLASKALTTEEMSPARANCIKPSTAEAVPLCSLNLAIAKVVVLGVIKPSIAILVKILASKRNKFGYKRH